MNIMIISPGRRVEIVEPVSLRERYIEAMSDVLNSYKQDI